MKIKRLFQKACCLTLTAVMCSAALSGCAEGEERPADNIMISEVMNNNHSILPDASGEFHDWIELYNPTAQTVSLDGYALSDNEKKPRKWIFPEGTSLRGGEYLVVFCSGLDSVSRELHTNFRISSEGEAVVLSDRAGKIASRIEVPRTIDDISCGYTAPGSEKLVYYAQPTPGQENAKEYAGSIEELKFHSYPIYINEYTTFNQYGFFDEDGDCPTWVELYNYGTEDIILSGMHLSDSMESLDKWTFPGNITLNAGQYMVVMLSGKAKITTGGELHTSFKLGAQDTDLILSDQSCHIVDAVKPVMTEHNVSVGRSMTNPEQWVYYARSTPGHENSSEEFDSLAAGAALPVRQVWINETLSVSGRREDVCTFQNDWIELHNGSDSAVDLSGYSLSDSPENFQKFQFQNCVLEPGEYLVLEANGQQPTQEHPFQLPFKLSNTGETLYLMREDGTLCDLFQTGRQLNGVSSGRGDGPDDARLFFREPTKGKANTAGVTGYSPMPVFSRESIYAQQGDTVELWTANGAEIRYTTDGSVPTWESALYTEPISLTKNVTIRASSFTNGLISGGVATHTYLISDPHDIAVACLSTDDANLFDYHTGIYADGPGKSYKFPHKGANFWKDWERPVHFEFYEQDGCSGISFDAGIMIFGQYSRATPQKSMSIHLREAYGPSQVRYPFFANNDVTEYHDLLLRSSGQDWNIAKLRDGMMHMIVKDQMDLDLMDYRPVAVYINGEYWGLYNLRDKVNEDYLYTHRGVDPDNLDIIKGNGILLSGSMDGFKELLKYLRTHDLSVQENFDYVSSIVDVDEVMNYWITETFFANTDTGNIKYYRERTPEGKWRLILFDLDWGLFPSTYKWDMIGEAIDPRGHGVGNMFYTDLLCGLLDNPGFRQRFIETYAKHLNTTFAPERTQGILTEMAAVIESEMPRQYERWGMPGISAWNWQIEFLKGALEDRVKSSKEDLQSNFHLSTSQMNELFPEG